MSKLSGAAVILLASFISALLRIRKKEEGIRRLRALSESLLRLRAELCERRRNLKDAFALLAQRSEEAAVSAFYARLGGQFCSLGERGFSEIWRASAERCFADLGERACGALFPLGDCLGGSELDRQCAALASSARELDEEARERSAALKDERKLSFGLSLSAGAFLVIILM